MATALEPDFMVLYFFPSPSFIVLKGNWSRFSSSEALWSESLAMFNKPQSFCWHVLIRRKNVHPRWHKDCSSAPSWKVAHGNDYFFRGTWCLLCCTSGALHEECTPCLIHADDQGTTVATALDKSFTYRRETSLYHTFLAGHCGCFWNLGSKWDFQIQSLSIQMAPTNLRYYNILAPKFHLSSVSHLCCPTYWCKPLARLADMSICQLSFHSPWYHLTLFLAVFGKHLKGRGAVVICHWYYVPKLQYTKLYQLFHDR